RQNMWDARCLEFYPIANRNWNASQDYHPFESRFVKAAKEAGFGKTSEALAGAMFEMADNIIQHSSESSQSISPGLLGYHVVEGKACFVISDGGQGALASLQRNPRWIALKNSKDALLAIIENHASSRQHGGEGEGFKEVFRSIANLNGVVELRSFDGNVKITGSPNGRCAEVRFIGRLPGFQVRVSCALTAENSEHIFPIDYLT
ncbi:MAG: uncharacterized protein JWM68_3489, partial [Verrucomicrobiales bacterium]|nr:uncharacterized protein [Verrucomicrobiales bacterium]